MAASKRAMGFKEVTPHQSTVARLFRRLDPALRAASLPAWDMRVAVSEEQGHGRH